MRVRSGFSQFRTWVAAQAAACSAAPRGVAGLLVLLGLLAWIFVHVALVPYLAEDSYIHLRVAEQLVRHGQPYFNTGEAVKTSSSTPWTLLLGLHFLIAPRNLRLIAVTSAMIGAASLGSQLSLLRKMAGRALAGWEIALIALVHLGFIHTASVAAMETTLALLFASLGLNAFWSRKPAAFAWLVLAAWTRPELLLLLAGAACLAALTRVLPLRSSLRAAALVALPAVAYELLSYGTLVPHAAVAKAKVHVVPLRGVLFQALPPALMNAVTWDGFLFIGLPLAYFMLATFPLLAAPWSRARLSDPSRQVSLLAALTGLGIAATYITAHGLIFPWYRALYFVPLFLPALAAAAKSGRAFAYFAPLLLALPFAYELGRSCQAALGRPERFPNFLEGARARRMIAVAQQLQRSYPGSKLATAEIGALGYGFAGKVLDAAGIASPELLHYHPLPVPEERHDPTWAPVPRQLVRELSPELVVSVDRHMDAVLEDPVVERYVHQRLPLYFPADEARRPPEELLWQSARYLEVLVRGDIWARNQPPQAGLAQ